jgi:hypothetical protein
MPYPKTILTRPIRRMIMSFFILCFFIISPLIIFYTAGYRYDFVTRQIKQTGVISIDVKPQNANVYLNGVLINQKIPIRLPNRAPGTYQLKIESSGYQTWEKEISVESKQTYYIRGVSLFKQSLPVELFDFNQQNIIASSISPFGDYTILLKKIDSNYEVELINLKTNKTTAIFHLPIESESIPVFEWSPYYSFVLLKITNSTGTMLYVIDPTQTPSSELVGTSLPLNSSQYQWSPAAYSKRLFIRENDSIVGIIGSEKISLLDSPALSPVWFVDKDLNVWQYSDEEKSIENAELDKEKIAFAVEKPITKIIDVGDNRIIAKAGEELLIIPIKKGDVQNRRSIGVQSINYNGAKDEWLAWSPWELWTIYPDGRANILQRGSKNIRNAAPLDSFGVILLLADNSIYGFNPGYYVSHLLFESSEINSVSANLESRKIYFIGKVGTKNGLYELDY